MLGTRAAASDPTPLRGAPGASGGASAMLDSASPDGAGPSMVGSASGAADATAIVGSAGASAAAAAAAASLSLWIQQTHGPDLPNTQSKVPRLTRN